MTRSIFIFFLLFLSSLDYSLAAQDTTRNELSPNELLRRAAAMSPANRMRLRCFGGYLYTQSNYEVKELEKIPDQHPLSARHVVETYSRVQYTPPANVQQHVLGIHSTLPTAYRPLQEAVLGYNYELLLSQVYDEVCFQPGAEKYYNIVLERVQKGQENETLYHLRLLPKIVSVRLPRYALTLSSRDWQVVACTIETDQSESSEQLKMHAKLTGEGFYLPHRYEIRLFLRLGKIVAEMETHAEWSDEAYESTDLCAGASDLMKEQGDLGIWHTVSFRNKIRRETQAALMDLGEDLLLQERHFGSSYSTDSLALRQGLGFWLSRRLIPLDSLSFNALARYDAEHPPLSRPIFHRRVSFLDASKATQADLGMTLLIGGAYPLTPNRQIILGGLTGVFRAYDFVDGFQLGQKIGYQRAFSQGRSLLLSADLWGSTASKRFGWELASEWKYAPRRMGVLSLNGGSRLADINRRYPTEPLWESLSALAGAWNVARWYHKRFFTAELKQELTHGLLASFRFDMEERQAEKNRTRWNLFQRRPDPNMPPEQSALFPSQRILFYKLGLLYTPQQRYRYEGFEKLYLQSLYPSFGLEIEQALPFSFKQEEAYSHYTLAAVSMQQSFRVGLFSSINYLIRFGGFLYQRYLQEPDLRYVSQSASIVTTDKLFGTFNVLPYYTGARKHWLELHGSLLSEYFLVKQIPSLRRWGLDEGLHLHYLFWDQNRHHFEGGYSIGWGDALRLGLFVGVASEGFQGVRLKLSAPIGLDLLRAFKKE